MAKNSYPTSSGIMEDLSSSSSSDGCSTTSKQDKIIQRQENQNQYLNQSKTNSSSSSDQHYEDEDDENTSYFSNTDVSNSQSTIKKNIKLEKEGMQMKPKGGQKILNPGFDEGAGYQFSNVMPPTFSF